MGFLSPDIIASNAAIIIPNATYHFGVPTSNVHMAWMRTIAGRLKSDYHYSVLNASPIKTSKAHGAFQNSLVCFFL